MGDQLSCPSSTPSFSFIMSLENPRGIPKADFVEDIPGLMEKTSLTAAELIEQADTQYNKYKFLEEQLTSKQRRLRTQIVDIKATLGILGHLKSKMGDEGGFATEFRLSDALFARAQIPKTDKVSLWLGANVMLEYETPEAEALLSKNFATAKENLAVLDDDTDFLRDQITTTEVNMARFYNHDVTQKRLKGQMPPK